MTSESVCKLAHELELTFNPYCGYQIHMDVVLVVSRELNS